MRIVRVDVASTLALRQRVLRPHQTPAELAAESLAAPEAAYFAAFEAGDEPVAVGAIRRSATPWPSGARDPWRLTGMATDPERRGRGLGAAVLAAALGHAEQAGGDLVWCNARTGALRFYERAGFVTVGEPWTDPMIGPHVRMWRATARPHEP